MKLSFIHSSQDVICPNGTFGGYPVTQYGLDDYYSIQIEFEVDDMDTPSLFATLAEDMRYWGDYIEVSKPDDLLNHLTKLSHYYSASIDEQIHKDDFDDYFILILQAKKVLESGIELKHFHYFFDVE